MSTIPGINFLVRPNKHIQRKMVFYSLLDILSKERIKGYRYIGFGGRWFADFILAHKLLGLKDMVSIERAEHKRTACFNQPYGCITVEGGDSTLVLPELPFERETLVWLDYNHSIDGPVLADVRILCEKALASSILLVTINAHKGNLRSQDDTGLEIPPEDVLRRIVGTLVPDPLPAGSMSTSRYPELLARILLNHFAHCCRVLGRPEIFAPIFSIFYRDNAPMITVGGMLAEKEQASDLRKRIIEVLGLTPIGEPVHRRIEVPSLTAKEKSALDKLLPRELPPSQADVSGLGFDLSEVEINMYHRHYLHYPIFGEVDAL